MSTGKSSSSRHGRPNTVKQSNRYSEYKWECCQCSDGAMGGMDTAASPFCSECGHTRCSDCRVTRVERSFAEQPYRHRKRTYEEAGLRESRRRPQPSYTSDPLSRQSFGLSVLSTLESNDFETETNGVNLKSSEKRIDVIGTFSGESDAGLDHQLVPFADSVDRSHPLYPLDLVNDEVLLRMWHDSVLNGIESAPDKFTGLHAIHLFRQGETIEKSKPTILASIRDVESEEQFRKNVSALLDGSSRWLFRISFNYSAVRRTMGDYHLPAICQARNTAFQKNPRFGASVGIRGKIDCTASLGGYLLVDGIPFAITVNHIISDLTDPEMVILTHPSEQECLASQEWRLVQNYLSFRLNNCCVSCRIVRDQHSGTKNTYKSVEMWNNDFSFIQDGTVCLGIHLLAKAKSKLLNQYPRDTLGTLFKRSSTRSRQCVDGTYLVEMDWALFKVDQWTIPLNKHISTQQSTLNFAKVTPGTMIKASGRTSGENQLGLINTAMSLVHQGNGRFTREWTIARPLTSNREEWISGGIGVDGDSGAWIMDRDEECLYGMAWGRHEVGLDTFSLFTPIEEIVADIKELTGAEEVRLTSTEEYDNVTAQGKGKGKMLVETEDLTVPLTIQPMAISEGGTEQEMVDIVAGQGRA